MKLVHDEAETPALEEELRDWSSLVTSVVGEIELRRVASRVGADERRLGDVVTRLTIFELDTGIRETAATLEQPLRTLDAIHLATAISLEDDLGAIACYDERLATAARAEGIAVVSPL